MKTPTKEERFDQILNDWASERRNSIYSSYDPDAEFEEIWNRCSSLQQYEKHTKVPLWNRLFRPFLFPPRVFSGAVAVLVVGAFLSIFIGRAKPRLSESDFFAAIESLRTQIETSNQQLDKKIEAFHSGLETIRQKNPNLPGKTLIALLSNPSDLDVAKVAFKLPYTVLGTATTVELFVGEENDSRSPILLDSPMNSDQLFFVHEEILPDNLTETSIPLRLRFRNDESGKVTESTSFLVIADGKLNLASDDNPEAPLVVPEIECLMPQEGTVVPNYFTVSLRSQFPREAVTVLWRRINDDNTTFYRVAGARRLLPGTVEDFRIEITDQPGTAVQLAFVIGDEFANPKSQKDNSFWSIDIKDITNERYLFGPTVKIGNNPTQTLPEPNPKRKHEDGKIKLI